MHHAHVPDRFGRGVEQGDRQVALDVISFQPLVFREQRADVGCKFGRAVREDVLTRRPLDVVLEGLNEVVVFPHRQQLNSTFD